MINFQTTSGTIENFKNKQEENFQVKITYKMGSRLQETKSERRRMNPFNKMIFNMSMLKLISQPSAAEVM